MRRTTMKAKSFTLMGYNAIFRVNSKKFKFEFDFFKVIRQIMTFWESELGDKVSIFTN